MFQKLFLLCRIEETREIEIIPDAHTGNESIRDAVEPTCTSSGYTGDTYCDDCGAKIAEGEVIAATGHDYSTEIVPPTCISEGYTIFTCNVCGYTYNGDIGSERGGHIFGEWETILEPTTVYKGKRSRICSLCEYVDVELIDKLPSKEAVKGDVTLIYTDDAYSSDVSLNVAQVFDGSAFQLLNSQKGCFKTKLYDINTMVEGVAVQPDSSVWVKIKLPADYDPDASIIYHVTNTGVLERMNSYIEDGYIYFETDHFSVYAIVDESAEDTSVVFGDLDNNGKLESSDARIALRASVALETLTDNQKKAADVDFNGKVEASDARLILRASVKLENNATWGKAELKK